MDIAADKNYVIQGQGDNGAVESWDGGVSWSNIWMRMNGYLSDVQAVDIGDAWGTRMVLAQMASGFGGNAGTGSLYVKKLYSHSPSDTWEFYAGGSTWKGGLPSGLFSDIAISPVNPAKVFVFSRGYGLYSQGDIGWGYYEHSLGNQPWFGKISNGIADEIGSVKKIAPHPTDENIVYLSSVSGNTGVFKGVYNGTDWTWSKIYNGSGWDAEVHAWEYAGKVYLFYSGRSAVDGDGNNFIGAISLDEGATWKTVLKSATTKSLVSHDWYNTVTTGNNPYSFRFENKGGLVGYDNKVIMSHHDHNLQKTYAVLQGTISGTTTGNASVVWSDFTGDLEFGGLTTAKVVQNGSQRELYVSTAGAGAWKRSLGSGVIPTGVAISGCPGSSMAIDATVDLNETVSPANASNKSVAWSTSNSAVATVSAAGLVRAVAAGTAVITVTTDSGGKKASCSVTVNAPVTGKAIPGKIEVEDYNTGGQGVGYNDLTSGNSGGSYRTDDVDVQVCGEGGYNVGWTDAGEWLDYNVNVATAGTYDLKLRVARSAAGNSTIKVLFGGVDKTGNVNVPSTGGWQTYITVTKNVSLSAGQQVMRISMVGGGYNINYIDIAAASSGISVASVLIGGCETTMTVGNTAAYSAIVSPTNATNKSVTWSTSNNAVATVTSAGLVTAVGSGTATITATTVDGNKTATCGVTVSGGSATAVTVRARMLSGSSDVLQLRVNDATVKTWTISGSSFATYTANVAVNGNVKLYFPDNGTDIEVDYLIVNGTTHQAEAQAVNTAVWQNGSCGGSNSQLMYCSGYIDFGTLGGGNTTSYRYLRLTGLSTVANDVTLQQIHWMVGSTSYPNPKLEWGTRLQVTSSNGATGDGYGAFDNTNGGWSAGSSYPTWITIDLGAGNAIAPDAIKLKPNASDRGFSNFQCHGSNDNTNWTLLYSKSGLTSANYAGGLTTFTFGSSSRESLSPGGYDAKLKVYPNPVDLGSDLVVESPDIHDFEVQIIDMGGKTIYKKAFVDAPNTIQLSTQTLSQSGIYFIRFNSESGLSTQKLMVK